MHLPTITAVAIACLGHDALVSANSGYYQTCNSVMLTQPQHNLIGNCKKTSGIYNVNNAIKLNSCFGNSNGNLVAQLNGGFDGSCKSISMSGSTLRASCGNGKGGWVSTSIDMNSHIGNQDGFMKCFNQNGY